MQISSQKKHYKYLVNVDLTTFFNPNDEKTTKVSWTSSLCTVAP